MLNSQIKLVFLIISFIGSSLSKKCPDIAVYPNFDETKYFGTWYGVERFFDPFELTLKCVKAEYSPMANGNILMNNTAIDKITNKFSIRSSEAYSPDKNNKAKMIVSSAEGPFKTASPYWIIDTDYISYSLVYICEEFLDEALDFAWILSRKPTLDQSIIARLKIIFDKNEINSSRFVVVDQSC